MATIDTLRLEIEKDSDSAEQGLDNLIKKLETLRSVVSNARGFTTAANGIAAIASAANSLRADTAGNLRSVVDALQGLRNIGNIKISSSIASQIKQITIAAAQTRGADFKGVKNLVRSLAPLQEIKKSAGLTSTISALRKLPEAVEAINSKLDESKIAEFADKVNLLRDKIKPLADEMRAVSSGFSALPSQIQKAIAATKRYSDTSNNASHINKKFLKSILRIGTAFYLIRRAFGFAMNAFRESNSFIESINLAHVAMGEGAEAAMEYADSVERLAGINSARWISQVGVFNQMIAGFGLSQSQSAHMSQQLTQLGYDIQSAFNVSDLSMVMDRLQSGLAGQIKGMREYGVELSVAAMKEFALERGITKQWAAMSMAEKTALRYAKIMADTTNIQKDLSRTIATPANSLRILSNEGEIAKRHIGQFVSVIATRLIPIVRAAVTVISNLAKSLAEAWGYVLPDIPETGVVGGLDDVEDAIDNIGGAAGGASKKMKDLLAGWDEINIIQSESGGGGGSGSILDSTIDLEDLTNYSYDFLDGMTEKTNEWVAVFTDGLEKIGELVPIALGGLLGLKFGGSNGGVLGLSLGGVVSWLQQTNEAIEQAKETGDMTPVYESFLSGALTSMGTGALLGAKIGGPWGAAAGAGIGLLVQGGSVAYAEYEVEVAKFQERLAEAYGEIEITQEEAQELVHNLLTTPWTIQLTTMFDYATELNKMRRKVSDLSAAITAWAAPVELGLTLNASQVQEYKADLDAYAQELMNWSTENTNYLTQSALFGGYDNTGTVTLSQNIQSYLTAVAESMKSHFANAIGEDGLLSNWDAYDAAMADLHKLTEYERIMNEALTRAGVEQIADKYRDGWSADSWNTFLTEMQAFRAKTEAEARTYAYNNIGIMQGNIDYMKKMQEAYAPGSAEWTNYQAQIDAAQDELDRFKLEIPVYFEAQLAPIDRKIEEMAIALLDDNVKTEISNFPLDDYIRRVYAPTSFGNKESINTCLPIAESLFIYNTAVSTSVDSNPDLHDRLLDVLMGTFDDVMAEAISNYNSGNAITPEQFSFIDTYLRMNAVRHKHSGAKYMMGVGLAEDSELLKSLSAELLSEDSRNVAKDKYFRLGLMSNLQIVQDATGGVSMYDREWNLITSFDSMSEKLRQNLEALGLVVHQTQTTPGTPSASGMFIPAGTAGAILAASGAAPTGVSAEEMQAAVSAGVQSANSDQNTLLREQNSLLKLLVQKEITARLVPSAAVGQAVRQAVNMYNKASGVNG